MTMELGSVVNKQLASLDLEVRKERGQKKLNLEDRRQKKLNFENEFEEGYNLTLTPLRVMQ